MVSHQITLTGNSGDSFDVCTNSGYLMEAFTTLQQEKASLEYTLHLMGFSLLACDRPDEDEPQAMLEVYGERMEVMKSGACYYYSAANQCYECLIAPGG